MYTLLTATLLLFLLWPAYAVLLRYSERYVLNRLLLLLVMGTVGALPFLSFESPVPVATQTIQGTIEYVEQAVQPAVEVSPALTVEPAASAAPLNEEAAATEPLATATSVVVPANTLNLVYFGGMAALLLVLCFRMLFLFILHLRSRPAKNGEYRLLHVGAKPGQAFTFGRNLYFSEDVPQGADFDHVLRHERVHARQAHTLDIVLSEVFLCLFWFHPAAWWLRTQLRANLEFLVDQAVVQGGANKRSYQLALVRQSQNAQGLALALPFSEPSLKSRIARLTGMPEYRLIAVLAAVALVFWLGVTVLVVRGTVASDSPTSTTGEREYLAAMAPEGDPYANHFRGLVDGPLASLEVYTNRMVTVDEYLQLRGILAMVPGARLYVYKQPFDDGYTLELTHNLNEKAVVHYLKPEPSTKFYGMIGMEFSEGAGHVPIAMHLQTDRPVRDGDGKRNNMISYITNTRTGSDINFFKMPEQLAEENLIVYINRQKIELIPEVGAGAFGEDIYDVTIRENGVEISDNHKVSVWVNGVGVRDRSGVDWQDVTVEGRVRLPPFKRMMSLTTDFSADLGDKYEARRQPSGTYRAWYEGLSWMPHESLIARYNDRPAKLDFLLDTDFGEDAMIQVGLKDRDGVQRYVVQVIDDTDLSEKVETVDLNDVSEVDFSFRRLPTVGELKLMRNYLSVFPEYDLRVFQDCGEAAGNYTLYLGNGSGTDGQATVMSVGEVLEIPLRFNVKKTSGGGYEVAFFQNNDLPVPPEMEGDEVYLVVNNEGWHGFDSFEDHYHRAVLDPAPDVYALGCLGTTPVGEGEDL